MPGRAGAALSAPDGGTPVPRILQVRHGGPQLRDLGDRGTAGGPLCWGTRRRGTLIIARRPEQGNAPATPSMPRPSAPTVCLDLCATPGFRMTARPYV